MDHIVDNSGLHDLPGGFSKVVGSLFLAAFAIYGTGSAIVEQYVSATGGGAKTTPDTTFVVGCLLMLANSLVVLMIGILLALAVWKSSVNGVSRPPAQGQGSLHAPLPPSSSSAPALAAVTDLVPPMVYVFARFLEAILLGFGAVCLLGVESLFGPASSHSGQDKATLILLLTSWNFFCYQLGMLVCGGGSATLFWYLRTSSNFLLPVSFATFACASYALLAVGAACEILRVFPGVGLWLSAPGAVFEIAFAMRLLTNGLKIEVADGRYSVVACATD
ncbi:unnamed protein product [Amoebophrya sp. A120]|nr:unnamed protein product [Amoebophrya sp. A120]|eukprot:GSA120T00018897001.1